MSVAQFFILREKSELIGTTCSMHLLTNEKYLGYLKMINATREIEEKWEWFDYETFFVDIRDGS